MNYLLRASSNDQDWNGDCDYFVVTIDKQIARTILQRRKEFLSQKKKDDGLWEMRFWGAHLECMRSSGVELNEEQQELYDDNGFLKLPDDFKVSDEAGIRTECEQLIIREESVQWDCYPKHAEGITIISDGIPYGLIEEIL